MLKILAFICLLVQPSHINAEITQLVSHLAETALRQDTNFQLVSQDIIAKKFPILDSSCVKRALADFLPQCLQYGFETISSDVRTQAAVKLSICELQASGVDNMPAECVGTVNFGECLRAMERTPQWWTTYSGNYQHLPSTCFENALPYEKEQILSLFLNITDVYSSFQEELVLDLEKYRANFEATVEASLQLMKTSILEGTHGVVTQLKDGLKDVNLKLEDMGETIIEHTDNVRNVFNDISDELNDYDMVGQIAHLKEDTVSLWQKINRDMGAYHDSQINSLYNVNAVFETFYNMATESVQEVKSSVIESQLETLDLITDFNSLVKSSILPILADELQPQLQEMSTSLSRTLAGLSATYDEHLKGWSDRVNDTLSKMEAHLDKTMGQVEHMSDSIENLEGKVQLLVSLGNALITYVKWIYTLSRALLSGYGIVSLAMSIMVVRYSIKLQPSWIQVIGRSTFLLVAVILGARTGTMLSY
ncbi:AaceriADR143Wp [[Ashbya] aceris (nom. inval.)]|nr:AaceriADR143Wp [[Ashbya] aceris (nom. inval.)]